MRPMFTRLQYLRLGADSSWRSRIGCWFGLCSDYCFRWRYCGCHQLPTIWPHDCWYFQPLSRLHQLYAQLRQRRWLLCGQSHPVFICLQHRQLCLLCPEQYLWSVCHRVHCFHGSHQLLRCQLLAHSQLRSHRAFQP